MGWRGVGWWVGRRFLPAMAASALVGALLGVLRAETLAFPVIQGMAAGALLGAGVGWNARGDDPARWSFGARLALTVGALGTYLLVQLGVFSFLLARGADSPFFWLDEILGGFHREPFFALGITGPILRAFSGVMTGGWWVFFNLLDGFFFGVLHLLLLGVGLGDRFSRRLAKGDRPSGMALCAVALLYTVAVGAVWGWVWYAAEERGEQAFSPASWQALEPFGGIWRFVEDAPTLFRSSRDQTFRLRVAGFGDLAGENASGRHVFHVSRRGGTFRGLLYVGGRDPGGAWVPSGGALAVRLRLAPEGPSLEGAVTLFGPGGRRDARFRGEFLSPERR